MLKLVLVLLSAVFLQGCGGGGKTSGGGNGGGPDVKSKCPFARASEESRNLCNKLCDGLPLHKSMLSCAAGMQGDYPSTDLGWHCRISMDSSTDSKPHPDDCTDVAVPDGCTIYEVHRGPSTMNPGEETVVCQFREFPKPVKGARYEKPPCASDELTANVQATSGATGTACFPHPTPDGKCPTNVPLGVSATPEKQKDGNVCFLSCSEDSECGTGLSDDATCLIGTGKTGVCAYPTQSPSVAEVVQPATLV